MLMLRASLNARIGRTGLPISYVVRLWTGAIAGAAAAWTVKIAIAPRHPVINAVLIVGPYGIIYFAAAFAMRIPEAGSALGRLRRTA
jgi:putative peptidoglycan lipid II flippase